MGTTAGSGDTGPAAVPADTVQPTGTGTGAGTGTGTAINDIRVVGGLTDNPNAENDDSEGEAYIKAGKAKQKKREIERMKAAGLTTEEANAALERNKGQQGDVASGGKRQGGKKRATKKK